MAVPYFLVTVHCHAPCGPNLRNELENDPLFTNKCRPEEKLNCHINNTENVQKNIKISRKSNYSLFMTRKEMGKNSETCRIFDKILCNRKVQWIMKNYFLVLHNCSHIHLVHDDKMANDAFNVMRPKSINMRI